MGFVIQGYLKDEYENNWMDFVVEALPKEASMPLEMTVQKEENVILIHYQTETVRLSVFRCDDRLYFAIDPEIIKNNRLHREITETVCDVMMPLSKVREKNPSSSRSLLSWLAYYIYRLCGVKDID